MRKIIATVLVLVFITGCSVVKQVQNFSKLQFKLHSVSGFTVNGIAIDQKSNFRDFGAMDVIKLTTLVTTGKLPVKFSVNVEAKNPNSGIPGLTSSSVTRTSFPFRLLIYDKESFPGNIKSPVNEPGESKTEMFPVEVGVDLVKLFKDQALRNLINVALQIGGKGGSPANLKILARPEIATPLGKFQYPDELSIIEKQYR